MNADELRPSERYALALAATAACVDRLKKLVRWSDRRDEALQAFLASLLRNEERRLDELERASVPPDPPGPRRLRHGDVRRFLEECFPSFYKPSGEGLIDRERGMYLAECLEEESADVYRKLAESAVEQASKTLFLRLEREDDSSLRRVRDVLLGQHG